MSRALSTVGKIAGLVAGVALIGTGIGAALGGTMILAGVGSASSIAAVAGAVSAVAGLGAQLTAKKPPLLGSAASIMIGADLPRPYMMGDTYSGGRMVHQVGYGATVKKVPNPNLAMAIVYSGAGPIAGIDTYYADFNPVAFSGNAATGYFAGHMYKDSQLGATPEADALSGPFGTIPQWGAGHKLSSMAAVLWSLRWDSKNGKYASGAPQMGVRGRGVLTYDPRKDSTYPGGSGEHRWVDPRSNPDSFAAARSSWEYSFRPGLHALRYALGTWERNPAATSDAPWLLTFGLGLPWDGIVPQDFVDLENLCDANGWEISGTIEEPGDKWANLKRILEAGGAEPCFKGGRLGLKLSAPRVSLDTIAYDDLAEGEIEVPGGFGWEERWNTAIPKFISPGHKWTPQQAGKITVTQFLEQDGEEKREELAFGLVKEPDQAAQLATYKLFDSREQGPVSLPVKPRLRRYKAGDKLSVQPELAAELGLTQTDVVVLQRAFDPISMTGTMVVMTENPTKHALALAQTGTAPAAIVLPTPEEFDSVHGLTEGEISAIIRAGYIKVEGNLLAASDAGEDATITVATHAWDYPDRDEDVERATGQVTGLDYSTAYHVYFDDDTLMNDAPTYGIVATQAAALNSTANPFRHYLGTVTTPAAGAPDTGGGGGGGGYCVTPDTPVLMANQTEKPAGAIAAGEWVWTCHEDDPEAPGGNYPVTAAVTVECPELFEVEIGGRKLRGSPDHPIWIDGSWKVLGEIGRPAGAGPVVRLTVADAHTYIAAGVLSHNKEIEPPV